MYILPVAGPYDLELSLKRLLDMPRQVVTRVEPGPTYVRAVAQGSRTGAVRVSAQPEGLGVMVEGDVDPVPILHQVRRAFQVDIDLAAVQAHMDRHDPIMAGIMRRYHGARPIGAFSLWESLAWSIIGQQVNIAFAFMMKESLVRLGGIYYRGLPVFPEPEVVAALPYETLQAEKYSRRKAEYVIDTARLVADGALDLATMVALPFEQAIAGLVKVRGIGRWTAECLLMDAGAQESFPAGDIGIRNAVARYYGLDHQPTEAEVRTIGAPWAPYSALACYYLWLGLLDPRGK